MERASPYYKGHLVVAAVRLFFHHQKVGPTAADIAKSTDYSAEEAQSVINMLKKQGVLEAVQAGDTERLFVEDPAPLEDLPREKQTPAMEKEIEKYAARREAEMKRIAAASKGEDSRKKDLFAALEEQLKNRIKDK